MPNVPARDGGLFEGRRRHATGLSVILRYEVPCLTFQKALVKRPAAALTLLRLPFMYPRVSVLKGLPLS